METSVKWWSGKPPTVGQQTFVLGVCKKHNRPKNIFIIDSVFGDFLFHFVQSDDVVMDLTKLFQCSVMDEFNDIMSDSVKSMSINNTSEWWALRTRLNVRMKVNNTAV